MVTRTESGFNDGGAIVAMSNEVQSLDKLAALINSAHDGVEAALVSGLENARRAGELLIQAKGRVGHGNWTPWLEQNFKGLPRTAQYYMRVSENWAQIAAKGGADSVHHALQLIARSREETPAKTKSFSDLPERGEPIELPSDAVDIVLRYFRKGLDSLPANLRAKVIGLRAENILRAAITVVGRYGRKLLDGWRDADEVWQGYRDDLAYFGLLDDVDEFFADPDSHPELAMVADVQEEEWDELATYGSLFLVSPSRFQRRPLGQPRPERAVDSGSDDSANERQPGSDDPDDVDPWTRDAATS